MNTLNISSSCHPGQLLGGSVGLLMINLSDNTVLFYITDDILVACPILLSFITDALFFFCLVVVSCCYENGLVSDRYSC